MKAYGILLMALLVFSVMPAVMAVSVGTGITPNIVTEQFAPRVWMCDARVWTDDQIEPQPRDYSRLNNYAFEGEQVSWKVLVMDKNGIEKIQDVFVTLGDTQQGAGNDIEVNCKLDKLVTAQETLDSTCNARIGEQQLDRIGYDNVAAYYTCTLTVETADSMYGEYWVTVEAEDLDGLSGTMAENEYWYFNPVIALSVDGDLTFDAVRPGSAAYSSTLLVGNDADEGSGVVLDMFIAGTNFYDSSSSGAKCPTTNQLDLSNFRYYATNGAFNTKNLLVCSGRAFADAEGYVGIALGNRIDQSCEIIGDDKFLGTVNAGNTLTPGAEMALTFKLSMPEPCNGDFDTGSIYFWGEAI